VWVFDCVEEDVVLGQILEVTVYTVLDVTVYSGLDEDTGLNVATVFDDDAHIVALPLTVIRGVIDSLEGTVGLAVYVLYDADDVELGVCDTLIVVLLLAWAEFVLVVLDV
jgi:hypothetical protein